jgi:hypothetical protein
MTPVPDGEGTAASGSFCVPGLAIAGSKGDPSEPVNEIPPKVSNARVRQIAVAPAATTRKMTPASPAIASLPARDEGAGIGGGASRRADAGEPPADHGMLEPSAALAANDQSSA